MPDTTNVNAMKHGPKETTYQRASCMIRKAQDLKKAALRTNIMKCLQDRPECMPEIASHLAESGYFDQEYNVAFAPGAGAKAAPASTPKKELNKNFPRVNTCR